MRPDWIPSVYSTKKIQIVQVLIIKFKHILIGRVSESPDVDKSVFFVAIVTLCAWSPAVYVVNAPSSVPEPPEPSSNAVVAVVL